MELASNSLTELVAERLKHMKLNWRDMARKFKNNYGCYNNNFFGRFAEKYVRTALEIACEDLEEKIVFDPIMNQKRTANYLLIPNRKHIFILSPDRQICYGEIDELLLIDNLPVIFEVTVAKWKGGTGGVSVAKRTSRTIHKFVPKMLDTKIKPLMEYYDRPCGYVIMALPDQIHVNSPYFENFINLGGIFVPFPFTYNEFRKEIEQLIKKI